jgi:RHS repeat-associated protein
LALAKRDSTASSGSHAKSAQPEPATTPAPPAATPATATSPTTSSTTANAYYDPTTGHWTQQDPQDKIASTTQGDRFPFAGSDPINQADPTGESAFGTACAVAAVWCFTHNIGEVYGPVSEGWVEEGIPLVEDTLEGLEEVVEVIVEFF